MHAAAEAGAPLGGDEWVRPMTEADLAEVLAIERVSFPTPWPRAHFLQELRGHRYAANVVLLAGRPGRQPPASQARLIGYACLWHLFEELKINNLAIHPAFRGRGRGSRLLRWLLDDAFAAGCREATLEVRPSNRAAIRLYREHGFREVGRRKDYYSDTREDAILMRAPLGGSAG